MHRLFVILALLAAVVFAQAQNLVPNGSFETYNSCPTTYGQLELATPWNKPNAGSTDYFNSCAPGTTPIGVPYNYGGGYQVPRTGEAYVGFSTYKQSYQNYREYIQVELTQPLLSSSCYFFEMYVNKKNTAKYATDRIGAHFRSGPKTGLSSTYLNLPAHIENPAGVILEDTVAWVPIRGYYNAFGGEDHLIIGNFHSDAGTGYIEHVPNSLEEYAFYYVDDVSLTELDFGLSLGPDTVLCSGEVIKLNIELPGAQYTWSDGSTSSEKTISSPGIYSVTVSVGQCDPITDTIRVSYVHPPRIDFGPDTSICNGETFTLDASTAFADYLWQDGSFGNKFIVEEAGTYSVEAINFCGTDSDTITLEYIECENLFFAPNAFTPNGDGINDEFCLKGAGLEKIMFRIYDRWGRLVQTIDEPGVCWDGQSGGMRLPSGIYHWVADYTGGGQTRLQKENRKTGFIYLLR